MIKNSLGLLIIVMIFNLTFFGAVTAHPGHGEPEKVDDATSDQGSGTTTSSGTTGTTGKTTTTSSGSTVSKSTGSTGTRSSGSSSGGVSSSSSASDGSGSAQAEAASNSDDGVKTVENTSAADNSGDGNSTGSNGLDDFPWALTAVILVIFFAVAAVFMLFRGGWINVE
ncbi:hypothetical protein [Methanobacterium aggregans]|uniref:hypothetical protein n=1 Tax=Methanobacterium aggregans TaxID=1615586 RepID=UPI001AE5EFA6|nr:hypothetical protein [Methanobacterium aggregans]MBP2046154.1 cytoskeletal protein RodZ [Methanobacterium aggregans]